MSVPRSAIALKSIEVTGDAYQVCRGREAAAGRGRLLSMEASASLCGVHHVAFAAVHIKYLVFPECADIAQEVAELSASRQRRAEAPISGEALEGRDGSGLKAACNLRCKAQYVYLS